jgi:hypothetical protein
MKKYRKPIFLFLFGAVLIAANWILNLGSCGSSESNCLAGPGTCIQRACVNNVGHFMGLAIFIVGLALIITSIALFIRYNPKIHKS